MIGAWAVVASNRKYVVENVRRVDNNTNEGIFNFYYNYSYNGVEIHYSIRNAILTEKMGTEFLNIRFLLRNRVFSGYTVQLKNIIS